MMISGSGRDRYGCDMSKEGCEDDWEKRGYLRKGYG